MQYVLHPSGIVITWNSSLNDAVEAETTDTFKNRLDKHYSDQDVPFNFHADITGIGSGSGLCTFEVTDLYVILFYS